MNLLDNIDDFKQKRKTELIIQNYLLSNEVLEYYINTSTFIDWESVSNIQPLNKLFIIKYFDKLNWYGVLNNKNAEISYELLDDLLYKYNLYEAYLMRNNDTILKRLITKHQHKYDVDKLSYSLNLVN